MYPAERAEARLADEAAWATTPSGAVPARLIDLGTIGMAIARNVVVEDDASLAEAMAELAARYLDEQGGVSVEDLVLHGFTAEEIRRLHPRWSVRAGQIRAAQLAGNHRTRLRVQLAAAAHGRVQ
jgi:hypothetical protein